MQTGSKSCWEIQSYIDGRFDLWHVQFVEVDVEGKDELAD